MNHCNTTKLHVNGAFVLFVIFSHQISRGQYHILIVDIRGALGWIQKASLGDKDCVWWRVKGALAEECPLSRKKLNFLLKMACFGTL